MVTLNINRLLSCILSKEHWTTVSVLCVDLMLHTLSKVLNSVTWLSLLDRNTLRPSSYFGLWGPAWALTFCISCKKKKKKKVNIERKKVFFFVCTFLTVFKWMGLSWKDVISCISVHQSKSSNIEQRLLLGCLQSVKSDQTTNGTDKVD